VADALLKSLGAVDKPTLLALNKADLGIRDIRLDAGRRYERTVAMSAITGQGIDKLLESITDILPAKDIELEIMAPYSEGWIAPYIHKFGKVLQEEYGENGIKMRTRINRTKAEKIREYVV
jgi:GTP-binding protein HflX